MEPVDPNDPLALNALFSGGGEPWAPILKPVIEGLPLAELFISPRRSRKVVPVRELTFQALKPNPPERWKVVVFGQNPYPRPESATGIAMFDNAFHSWNDKRFEYVASVRNIIKAALHWRHGVDVTLDAWQLRELLTTYAVVQPPEWFQAILAQGVLLLNASLTASADSGIPIEQHVAFWQPVTRAVIEAILSAKQRADAQHKGVVFAWWGVHARGLKPMVEALSRKYPDVPVRHVDHWNPAARDDRFCQGNHFKDINAALVSVGASRIAWLPTPGWQSRLMPSLETAQKMGDFVQETMDLHKLYLERLQGARDERLTDLPPIQGLLDGARVPLSQALKPVLATLSTVQSAAQSALAFASGLCARDPGLDVDSDEVAAIHLYTAGSAFYRTLNAALRDPDRTRVLPFLPYLRLLLSAFSRLAPRETTLWRGVGLDMRAQYPVGATVTWWGVSSCTSNKSVAMSFGGASTLFEVRARTAVTIKRFSAFSAEDEFILAPGTRLKVLASHPAQGAQSTVVLEESALPRLVS